MELSISPNNRLPIYRQIANQICAAVARGRLRAGQRLPSVRELSQSLVINPNTVARAYTELEREGVLNTRVGLGVFVAASRQELSKKVRRERLVKLIDHLLVEAVRLGFSADEVLELIAERSKHFQWRIEAETS